LNKLIEKRTIGLDATQIHDHFKPKRIAVRLKLAEIINFQVLDMLFPFFLPKLRTETADRTLFLLKHLTEKNLLKKTTLSAAPGSDYFAKTESSKIRPS
jgi:hypothetical protein